jgi:hypothetical protein
VYKINLCYGGTDYKSKERPQKIWALTLSGPVPGSACSAPDKARDRLLNFAALTFWFFIYYFLCEQTIQRCEKMDEEEMPMTVDDEKRPTIIYDHPIGEL